MLPCMQDTMFFDCDDAEFLLILCVFVIVYVRWRQWS